VILRRKHRCAIFSDDALGRTAVGYRPAGRRFCDGFREYVSKKKIILRNRRSAHARIRPEGLLYDDERDLLSRRLTVVSVPNVMAIFQRGLP